MLMPLGQLRTIYELLFRDGVMVAQKDRCPHSFHPQLPGVTHLQVQRAMGSLRSRGLVRETFAWRHCYWYLTDEGIAHLRAHLRLPPEIVPATLQRTRHPVARVRPASHLARTQTVSGPLACPPKPQEASREAYRRKEELGMPAVRAASEAASDARPAEGQRPSGGGLGRRQGKGLPGEGKGWPLLLGCAGTREGPGGGWAGDVATNAGEVLWGVGCWGWELWGGGVRSTCCSFLLRE